MDDIVSYKFVYTNSVTVFILAWFIILKVKLA